MSEVGRQGSVDAARRLRRRGLLWKELRAVADAYLLAAVAGPLFIVGFALYRLPFSHILEMPFTAFYLYPLAIFVGLSQFRAESKAAGAYLAGLPVGPSRVFWSKVAAGLGVSVVGALVPLGALLVLQRLQHFEISHFGTEQSLAHLAAAGVVYAVTIYWSAHGPRMRDRLLPAGVIFIFVVAAVVLPSWSFLGSQVNRECLKVLFSGRGMPGTEGGYWATYWPTYLWVWLFAGIWLAFTLSAWALFAIDSGRGRHRWRKLGLAGAMALLMLTSFQDGHYFSSQRLWQSYSVSPCLRSIMRGQPLVTRSGNGWLSTFFYPAVKATSRGTPLSPYFDVYTGRMSLRAPLSVLCTSESAGALRQPFPTVISGPATWKFENDGGSFWRISQPAQESFWAWSLSLPRWFVQRHSRVPDGPLLLERVSTADGRVLRRIDLRTYPGPLLSRDALLSGPLFPIAEEKIVCLIQRQGMPTARELWLLGPDPGDARSLFSTGASARLPGAGHTLSGRFSLLDVSEPTNCALIAGSQPGGMTACWRISLSGGAMEHLFDTAFGYLPIRLSGDKRWVIFCQGSDEGTAEAWCARSLETSRLVQLLPDKPEGARASHWVPSPFGSSDEYLAELVQEPPQEPLRYYLVRSLSDPELRRDLLLHGVTGVSFSEISPDGRKLAYERPRTVSGPPPYPLQRPPNPLLLPDLWLCRFGEDGSPQYLGRWELLGWLDAESLVVDKMAGGRREIWRLPIDGSGPLRLYPPGEPQ